MVFPCIADENEGSEDDFAHWEEYMKRFHILMKVSGHLFMISPSTKPFY